MTKQQLNNKNDDDNKNQHNDDNNVNGAQDDGQLSGDDGSDSNADPVTTIDPDGNGSGSDSGSQRTFTQDDVSRMMAREKQQGRNAAFNELGIDPNDTATMNLIKTILEAQKQQEEPPVAPSAELIEAQHRADIAEAKAQAMMLGANPQYVDDIVTLATAKLSESGDTDYKAVVDGIKSKYPVWFGVKDYDSDKPGHKGTGSALPSKSMSSSKGSEMSLGQRLAAARKPSHSKKSYWNNN